MIEEVKVNFGNVFYADKIACLLAVAVAVIGAEQVDIAMLAVLVEMMEANRCHTAFVLLLLSVNIEVAEADNLGCQTFFPLRRRNTWSNKNLE